MSEPATNTSSALQNRVILVTGAGDGIGKAASMAFAENGASVILLGRTTAKLENTYDEIVGAGFPQPAIIPLDLEGASPADYQQLKDNIQTEFGRLDGLLNNAAWLGVTTPFEQHDVEAWYRVMQININAQFLLTQAFIPLLKKSGDASIVFTTDNKTTAYWGAYGVSKAALDGFMKILSDELDSGEHPVKVNSINPGPVHTRMRTQAFPGDDAQSLPKPASVMEKFVYLMSTDSKGVTGKIFNLENSD